MSIPDEDPLDRAVAHLQGLRNVLGDAAIDAAIDALRRHALRPAANEDPQRQRLRQVSVLFADVANSTDMIGRVNAEDAIGIRTKGEGSSACNPCTREWAPTLPAQ